MIVASWLELATYLVAASVVSFSFGYLLGSTAPPKERP